jgi:hypothetical protein
MVSSVLVKENQFQACPDSTLYTLVTCIAADGSVRFCLYVFKHSEVGKAINQSLHVPVLCKPRATRNHKDYPIYYAVAPKGYMNGELWKETMKIFKELVLHRQGLGRLKQAVLFLDGCASHLKDFTNEDLAKDNIIAIYFPANTSHVLQPCDGQPFALYKSAVARSSQKLALKASLGSSDEKTNALLACMQCYEKAVTPEVVKGAFRDRGIFPWDTFKATANAQRASPTIDYIEANTELQSLHMAFKVLQTLKDDLTPSTPTQRKTIQVLNSPVKSEELENWKRRSSSAKSGTPPPKKVPMMEPIDGTIEYDDESETYDDSEAGDLFTASFEMPPSSNSCSGCGHTRTNGTVPVACFDCKLFWLCMPCQTNTETLAQHLKSCFQTEGRALRRRQKS